MVCSNCHKQIDPDSKFCRYCGANVDNNRTDKQKDDSDNSNSIATSKNIKLWDKFAEIYDSTGDERKIYEDLSSSEVWELIRRISNNKFEDFIQEHKELLNKQPYKVIETLKNVFGWCASGGYWFWMAEALLENKKLKELKDIALNHFIEEWQTLIAKKYDEHQKNFSPDLEQSMSIFFEYEVNTVLNSAETVKDLPNELIDKLKTELFIEIFWGYLAGVAESKYRK